MAHYLVKIKPVEHYFFGIEKVGNLGNRKPYYLETTEFPQQTSILGLLRYIILLKKDKLGKISSSNKDEINELIGEGSFPGNEYGKILSLSPVFILDEAGTAYFARPIDWEYTFIKKNTGCKVSYGKDSINESVPFLEGYKAKNGIDPFLISSKGESIPLWYDKDEKKGVLRKKSKAGNQKNPERFMIGQLTDKDDPKNEAYYKQEFLYMEKQFSYACIAEIDLDELKDYTTVLPFGGERSSFSILFKKLDETESVDSYYFSLQPKNDYLKIELLSDAFVEQTILDLSSFAACDTIGFRNLKTKTSTKNYSRISRKTEDNSADLSDQLQLLKRGSVLFFDSMEQLQKADKLLTEGKEYFAKIGYNKFRKFEHKKINDHGTI
jgi:CRISPR-associated protein Cmr3